VLFCRRRDGQVITIVIVEAMLDSNETELDEVGYRPPDRFLIKSPHEG
jgi:hypothetical protein